MIADDDLPHALEPMRRQQMNGSLVDGEEWRTEE